MIETECHIWGEDFNPSCVHGLAGVIVRNLNTRGETATTGPHKSKPISDGACILAAPPHIPVSDRIGWMADFIGKHIESFRKAGATDIVYWIYWKGIQGNMEFTVAELKKISALGIPLCIDYIQMAEEEYGNL